MINGLSTRVGLVSQLLAAVTAALSFVAAADARVILRAGLVEEAPVVAATAAGLELGGPTARTVGWDAILRVEGESAAIAAPFAALAEKTWRARTRLARGDIALAAPLFAELYAQYGTAGGPTGRLICEGELRCRLAGGDVAGAVEPWLLAVRATLDGARLAGGSMARGVIDPESLLAPPLAPIFGGGPDEARRVRDIAAAFIDDDPSIVDPVEAFAIIFAAAAQTDDSGADLPLDELDRAIDAARAATGLEADAWSGVAFARDILAAQADAGPRRDRARRALRTAIAEHAGTWREAWARAALGRSLINTTGEAESTDDTAAARRRGVLTLLHVPARFAASQPYLAGVALADAARAMSDAEAPDSAQALIAELEDRFRSHPALIQLNAERSARQPDR